MIKSLLPTFLILALSASANDEVKPFGSLNDMVENQVYYKHDIQSFAEWKDGDHKQVLNLFPGFRDGISRQTPGLSELKIGSGQDIVVYMAQTRVLVNRAASQIDWNSILDLERVKTIHQNLARVRVIQPGDLETYRRQNIFFYRNPPNRNWCQSPSLCLELDLIFDTQFAILLTGGFCWKEPDTCKESFKKLNKDWKACLADPLSCLDGVRAQSEMRLEKPEEKTAENERIKRLTGASTPIQGILVENFFWFNHVIEFGKHLIVIQDHPNKKNKTLITSFTVFGIDKKWWNRSLGSLEAVNLFLGLSALNGSEGAAQGLPPVIQQMAGSVANELQK